MRTPALEQWIYVEGVDRSSDGNKVVSHIYSGPSNDELVGPLCARGWNRSNGDRFSIWRGHTSEAGTCAVCLRRKSQGLGPVPSRTRKTKYI